MVAPTVLAWFGLALVAIECFAQSGGDVLQRLLSRYQSEPNNALLCEQIGVLYTRQNDFEPAAGFFQKALALDPQRVPAKKNLATVLWFLGRKSESTALFSELEKRIPNDPVPQLYLGLGAYDKQNMESAAGHFQRAGALASDNAETLPFVVESYLASRRFEAVSQLLERSVSSGKGNSQVYRWLGEAYDRQMLPDKAFQAYSKAIAQAPELAQNYLALAGFSIEHANPSFAREILARGLKQVKEPARLQFEIGLTWAIAGNFEAAKQSFAEAHNGEPTWPMPLLGFGRD